MALIPRKSIHGWTVYERKPKPKSISKYVVGTSLLHEYKNFSRYSKAVRWIKQLQENDEIYKLVLPVLPKEID